MATLLQLGVSLSPRTLEFYMICILLLHTYLMHRLTTLENKGTHDNLLKKLREQHPSVPLHSLLLSK